jgi:uncharacterized membrane protein
MFRKDLPDAKRVVLFMTGTALFLTLFVELVVLSGDIGRMNTVFKFYLQAWVLFAVSAAAAGGWLFSEMRQWNFNMRVIWQVFLALLLAAAALFPIIGTGAKVRDRMAADAPYTLDGMAFMPYSEYADLSSVYDLSQDYQAIQWLQQNVAGSPVIVEGHTPEYRWGNRMTIYTGLPSVLGWRNHQNQQRIAGPPEFLPERAEAIPAFYNTTDADEAAAFLETYGVKYVIVGQLERTYYPGPGLAKFELLDGVLWQEVFRVGDTVIYKVIE